MYLLPVGLEPYGQLPKADGEDVGVYLGGAPNLDRGAGRLQRAHHCGTAFFVGLTANWFGSCHQVGFALFGAALAVCALCGLVIMSHGGSSELLEVRLPNGRMANLVPVQQARQHRMQQLFGPGDLPIPIEDDGMPGGKQSHFPLP